MALREQLIEVAFAHAAAEGKSEKMELLYHYLAGELPGKTSQTLQFTRTAPHSYSES